MRQLSIPLLILWLLAAGRSSEASRHSEHELMGSKAASSGTGSGNAARPSFRQLSAGPIADLISTLKHTPLEQPQPQPQPSNVRLLAEHAPHAHRLNRSSGVAIEAASKPVSSRGATHQQPVTLGDGALSTPVKAVIVTALMGEPCNSYTGNYINVLSLKNKRDYAEMHRLGLYWATEQVDSDYHGPWNKVALLRRLMDTYSEQQVEYFWWVDQDTLFADISAELPWERYSGKDLVVWTPWGKEKMIQERSSLALNSGVLLFKNSDWSRTFLDIMLRIGKGNWYVSGAVEPKIEEMLSSHLSNYSGSLYEQSAFVYLLTKHPQLRRNVFMEDTLSWWKKEQPGFHVHYRWDYPINKIGDGTTPVPLLVHYAGCQFCGLGLNPQHAMDCTRHWLMTYAGARNASNQAFGFHPREFNVDHVYHKLAAVDAMLNVTEAEYLATDGGVMDVCIGCDDDTEDGGDGGKEVGQDLLPGPDSTNSSTEVQDQQPQQHTAAEAEMSQQQAAEALAAAQQVAEQANADLAAARSRVGQQQQQQQQQEEDNPVLKQQQEEEEEGHGREEDATLPLPALTQEGGALTSSALTERRQLLGGLLGVDEAFVGLPPAGEVAWFAPQMPTTVTGRM